MELRSEGVMVDDMRNWWGVLLGEDEGGVGSVGSEGIVHVNRP